MRPKIDNTRWERLSVTLDENRRYRSVGLSEADAAKPLSRSRGLLPLDPLAAGEGKGSQAYLAVSSQEEGRLSLAR